MFGRAKHPRGTAILAVVARASSPGFVGNPLNQLLGQTHTSNPPNIKLSCYMLLWIHELGCPSDFAIAIDACQDRGGLGQKGRIGRPGETVSMLDLGRRYLRADRLQVELVVVIGRSAVLYAYLGDDEKKACRLEGRVRQPVGPKQLGPAHLEPDRIYAVMHDPGLVGLDVPGHNFDFMPVNRQTFRKIRHTTFLKNVG